MKVSIVVPTRNEEGNIARLIDGINEAVKDEHEIVVVDDSDNNQTIMIAGMKDAVTKKGQHQGLGQAIIDGIKEASGDIVVVMDADLSHDPKAVLELLKPIMEQGFDIVIGSRYVKGGDFSDWALDRKIKSLVGVKLMQLVTGIRDSNSGFFAFRKSIVDTEKLNGRTWKIMLEVLFKADWVAKREVPIKFGDRVAGESKRSTKQVFKDAINLIRLTAYKWGRFINFAVVGGIGALWYFGILYFLTEYMDIWYGLSAIIATLVAITNNYVINHYYTFRHVKQYNTNLFKGWLKYVGNSAIGDGVDWLVLVFLTEIFGIWYMLSAFIASGVACIIKYTIAKKYIWGKKGRKAHDADYEWYAFYKGLPWQKRWKQLLARIVKDFAGDAGRVLDVGCGSSPQGLLLNHDDYIGIDPNKDKIDYMNSKSLKNAVFYHGDLNTITFIDKFDTVLFLEVIEHLEDMDEAHFNLSTIYKYLKPHGKLIVATPNFGGFFGQAMDSLYGIFQKNAYAEEHQLKFDLPTLIMLCEQRGFRYIKSKIPSGADMVCLFERLG